MSSQKGKADTKITSTVTSENPQIMT
uniref:Uncharacterized protein n=1 Tax=Arundo donax TaxID=35708 RepID=A0A0A9AEH0_ARUDO